MTYFFVVKMFKWLMLFAGIWLLIYLPRAIAWFGAVKPQKRFINEKQNRIAVVIPARNESKSIGPLLDCLDNQSYAKENFDTYVVVAEKDDPTIQMAQEHGMNSMVVTNQRCKSDALNRCFQGILRQKEKHFDAFLILDADCLLDEKCLEEFNNALAGGGKVVLSKKLVKNYLPENNAKVNMQACCNGILWTLIDDMGNRFKSDHGYTIMTIGTGLMISYDVIESLGGWPYNETLTEDIEFMYDMACKKIKTTYYSYAKIYMEEAPTLSATNKRRRRWLDGVVQSMRVYREKVKENTVTKKDMVNRYYVNGLVPIYWYIGTLTLLGIFELGMAAILFVLRDPMWFTALLLALIPTAVIYVSFLIMTAFAMAIDGKNIRLSFMKKVALFFVHPLFYMGYIPIIAKAIFLHKEGEWEIIDRIDFAS